MYQFENKEDIYMPDKLGFLSDDEFQKITKQLFYLIRDRILRIFGEPG